MKPRLRTLLPAVFASLALAGWARAEDVELGKIVGGVGQPSKAEPAAPAPAAPAAPGAPAAKPDTALASAILTDCNEIATATNLWAQEKKKAPSTRVTLRDIVPYMKPDSPVVSSGGNDRLGNPYDFGTAEAGPFVSANTVRDLAMPTDFWGDYAPRSAAAPTAQLSKQEIAASTLADLKQIRLAILKRDAEGAGDAKEQLEFAMLKGYLPEDSDLWKAEGADRLGNDYVLGTVKDPVHLSPESYKELAMPKDYWGEFAPKAGATATRSSSTASRKRSSAPQEKTFGRKIKDFFKGR